MQMHQFSSHLYDGESIYHYDIAIICRLLRRPCSAVHLSTSSPKYEVSVADHENNMTDSKPTQTAPYVEAKLM